MAPKANQPVIVKKVRKGHGHGHHGGSWKVAYADFVTAMMAFFLLLWLLNVTTEEQRLGIANYFLATPYLKDSKVGSTGFSGGHSLDDTGQLNAPAMTMPGITVGLPAHDGAADAPHESTFDGLSDQDLWEQFERAEQAELERVTRELRQAIANDPELRELGRNLLVDRTPEGIRIQILDEEQRSMFPLGSATMYPYTRSLMAQVVRAIEQTDRPLSITGHTDSVPFRAGSAGDNWQLSADRANASRRALIETGLPAERIARVVGMAETEPLNPDDPGAASNRRISIVLLRGSRPATAPAAR